MCRDCNGKYKFSFMEMITSGRNGSTSATGFVGVVLSIVCILMAVAIFIFYFVNTKEAENICEITVAMAAPLIPRPNTKIKTGSRMILQTAPITTVSIPIPANPWALIKAFSPNASCTKIVPTE